MKLKSILSSALAFLLVSGSFAFADGNITDEPQIKRIQALNVDFQSDEWYTGDHPVNGNYLNGMVAQGNSTVTVHEDENGNRYASVSSGAYLGADVVSMKAVYISFDFMLGSDSARLTDLIRGNLAAGSSAANLSIRYGSLGVNDGAKWINLGAYSLNMWYHLEYTVYAQSETYDIKITDENGKEYSATGLAFQKTGYTDIGHIRFVGSTTTYWDNFVYEEDITLPQIESVSDESGNTEFIDYNSESVTISLTEPLLAVTKDDITVINKRTLEELAAEEVLLDGNNIVITFKTHLQSANEYEIKTSDTLCMMYREIPLEKSLAAEFSTLLRDLDVSSHSFEDAGESINLSMTLKNSCNEGKTITVMAVLYDSDMRIVSLTTSQITADSESESTAELTIGKKCEKGTVKAFVFTDFSLPVKINNNIYTFTY